MWKPACMEQLQWHANTKDALNSVEGNMMQGARESVVGNDD